MPVIVLKRWDGKTLKQQLGFPGDPKAGKQQLAQMIDAAVKDNGPIIAPKKFKALQAAYQKGVGLLGKKKVAEAIKEFRKVVADGEDKKTFPGDPPAIVQDAKDKLAEIAEAGGTEIDKADALAETDPKKAKAEYQRLLRIYGGIEELKARIDEALAKLP